MSERPFQPAPIARFEPEGDDVASLYVYCAEVVLAVNIALVTNRALLVRGDPGSGKSSLARNVARTLGWAYYEFVVTSRTDAQDLLWTVDSVARLADAQLGRSQSYDAYLRPGILWEAWRDEAPGSVVLVDEIDKADPQVPNDLLAPIDCRRLFIPENRTEVRSTRPCLLILTSNDERELAPAFERRCVQLRLPPVDEDGLLRVARAHLGDDARARPIARLVVQLAEQARRDDRRPPGTAEFLDTLRACRELGINPGSSEWDALVNVALAKK